MIRSISRALDKDLWFLEAHLQGRPPGQHRNGRR